MPLPQLNVNPDDGITLRNILIKYIYFSDSSTSNSPILISMYHLDLTPESYKLTKYPNFRKRSSYFLYIISFKKFSFFLTTLLLIKKKFSWANPSTIKPALKLLII